MGSLRGRLFSFGRMASFSSNFMGQEKLPFKVINVELERFLKCQQQFHLLQLQQAQQHLSYIQIIGWISLFQERDQGSI